MIFTTESLAPLVRSRRSGLFRPKTADNAIVKTLIQIHEEQMDQLADRLKSQYNEEKAHLRNLAIAAPSRQADETIQKIRTMLQEHLEDESSEDMIFVSNLEILFDEYEEKTTTRVVEDHPF